MVNKKFPPCEQYGSNHTVYVRKGEQLCRKRKQKKDDLIIKRLDTIIELLKRNSGPQMFRGPPIPPPPPPPRSSSRSNANRTNKRKSPPKKVDPLVMARASLMNNLKKALSKRTKTNA